MVLEFLAAAVILTAWIFEMQKNLAQNQKDKKDPIFLLAYFVGFAVLAVYAVDIKNVFFEFLFALLALLTLLEFAFIMIKRY